MKKSVFYIITILFPWLIIEVVFRLLPVSNPPYLLPVSSRDPIVRLQPNVDYLYSKGWNFSVRARKHSNNFGFNHVSDYHPAETTPLLMVVGDSFVEAHQIDAGKSLAEILHSRVDGVGRVYSMGISGAALSQYLAYAQFASATFRPSAMAFVIIENDFDESLLKYKSEPRLHYFDQCGEQFRLCRIDYELSTIKMIARRSAFARYIVLNLDAGHTIGYLSQIMKFRSAAPLNLEERIDDSKRAVDYFLDQLPKRSGLDTDSVVFVVDAMRPAMYSPAALLAAQDSYVGQMRRYFMNQARARGYEVVDMESAFMRSYQASNRRFEFSADVHWNEIGHRTVANAMENSAVFNRTFDRHP